MTRKVEDWKLEQNKKTAKENVERSRDKDALKWECVFAARHLGFPEDDWEKMVPLMYAIEEGRLYSLAVYQMTPEELKSWHEYLATRNG